jgi:hypothetical protein
MLIAAAAETSWHHSGASCTYQSIECISGRTCAHTPTYLEVVGCVAGCTCCVTAAAETSWYKRRAQCTARTVHKVVIGRITARTCSVGAAETSWVYWRTSATDRSDQNVIISRVAGCAGSVVAADKTSSDAACTECWCVQIVIWLTCSALYSCCNAATDSTMTGLFALRSHDVPAIHCYTSYIWSSLNCGCIEGLKASSTVCNAANSANW